MKKIIHIIQDIMDRLADWACDYARPTCAELRATDRKAKKGRKCKCNSIENKRPEGTIRYPHPNRQPKRFLARAKAQETAF
jgi:hypothetical protein